MSKIVTKKKSLKISKNLKKSLFFKNPNFFKNICDRPKKLYLFLNIRNTGFDQSSPVQPNPEKIWKTLEKSQKIPCFQKI